MSHVATKHKKTDVRGRNPSKTCQPVHSKSGATQEKRNPREWQQMNLNHCFGYEIPVQNWVLRGTCNFGVNTKSTSSLLSELVLKWLTKHFIIKLQLKLKLYRRAAITDICNNVLFTSTEVKALLKSSWLSAFAIMYCTPSEKTEIGTWPIR